MRGQDMTPEDREAKRRQYNAVWRVMIDGRWRTLESIQNTMIEEMGLYAPEQSISARLRDFRKKKHGAHTVDRFEWQTKPRVFKYRLIRNTESKDERRK